MTTHPKILYVEDEALVAMTLVMALEEAGFAVEHVVNGRLAIMALQKRAEDYTALLTDVRLPEVDGWLIARRAREMRPDLPVVYVSGDSAADWSANGVDGSIMLPKPVSNERVIATIKALIDP